MYIQLDTLASKRLEEHLAEQSGYLKLFYDTEGCGCNGVLVIQIVSEPNNTDIVIQREPFTFLCDRQQESLFDERMRLEADEHYPSFKLSSDSSLFSNNVRIQDLRTAD
ncbi:iron-sulfur cluster biosynthesis family protein [Paenibacillus sp. HW567]|uniref:iron-sulfur cluster biosynthesis family protein n=1 Tax=Paenibacillus sp. HW567 TaxID=1034769 RepID=UPI000369056E|nr:iron-sulfur cluster biosynthesis family protein [Paenibacillus sp. HW567]